MDRGWMIEGSGEGFGPAPLAAGSHLQVSDGERYV